MDAHPIDSLWEELEAIIPPSSTPKPVRQAAPPAVKQWPKLVPIPSTAKAAPQAFPFHALGHVLGSAAAAIARDVQAPDSLAGGSVLAAAALAAQPLRDVTMPHGMTAPLSLYVITGAGSGDRKSATDAIACHAIEEHRKQQARDYSQELQAYEQALAAKKKGDPVPEVPPLRSLTTSNATTEGIFRQLKSQNSLGVFSAEGGEILGGHSMREDRRAAGMALLLKAWSGEALDALRGADGMALLMGRRVSMHVLVQPVLLTELFNDKLAREQGLLARCLVAQPDTLAGQRSFRPVNALQDPDVELYSRKIKDLLEQPPEVWPSGDSYELKPQSMHLSHEAKTLWIAFYNEVEAAQADGKPLASFRPFASKAAEQAARIAGVIALVEGHQAVNGDVMDGAIELVQFYMTEHMRLMGVGQQEQKLKQLRKLHQWMLEHATSGYITNTQVLKSSPYEVRQLKKRGLCLLLQELVQRGYVRSAGADWEVRDDE